MSHRIDLELTSARPDGTWTWRAAGARQPKGSLEASLLYEGAAVGDVVRADAELGLDGTTIVHLYPPRERRPEPERLVLLGPATPSPGVSSSLVPKARRGPAAGPERRGHPEREARGPRERPDGGGATTTRPDPAPSKSGEPDRHGQDPSAPGTPPRAGPSRPGTHGTRGPSRSGTPGTSGSSGTDPAGARGAPRSSRPGTPAGTGMPGGARHSPPRLAPGTTHRAAALAALPPEQRPIAEQILRGGLAAVRQAIEAQNADSKAEGRPEVRAEPLLTLAEQLIGSLKAAAWRDRAEAALAAGESLALRDLRSVVASADSATRDESGRMLAAKLRETLDARTAQTRQRWVDETTAALEGDKVLRALRASARPPDAGSRLPAELAVRLSRAAGAAMTPDTPPERWAALLDAAANSPVRRSVKPVGLPREPGEALMAAVRHASGRIPALAGLLGIDMPPPPSSPKGPAGQHRHMVAQAAHPS